MDNKIKIAIQNPTSSKGLLVISVDSRSFGSDFLGVAIRSLATRHKHVSVLVAHDLMTYNRYHIDSDAKQISKLIEQYWTDREKYLTRLVEDNNLGSRIEIGSYNDYCDRHFMKTYRKFLRIVMSDRLLKTAISRKAGEFIRTLKKKTIANSHTETIDTIRAFLIEETAWALHMAGNNGYTDQYYPGDGASLLQYAYQYPNAGKLQALLEFPPHSHRFWDVSLNSHDPLAINYSLAWEVNTI